MEVSASLAFGESLGGGINGKQHLEVQGKIPCPGLWNSMLVLNGGAWVRVCMSGVFARTCLLTQWDAAQAVTCTNQACSLWAEVLSFLTAPSFSVLVLHPCSEPHDQL